MGIRASRSQIASFASKVSSFSEQIERGRYDIEEAVRVLIKKAETYKQVANENLGRVREDISLAGKAIRDNEKLVSSLEEKKRQVEKQERQSVSSSKSSSEKSKIKNGISGAKANIEKLKALIRRLEAKCGELQHAQNEAGGVISKAKEIEESARRIFYSFKTTLESFIKGANNAIAIVSSMESSLGVAGGYCYSEDTVLKIASPSCLTSIASKMETFSYDLTEASSDLLNEVESVTSILRDEITRNSAKNLSSMVQDFYATFDDLGRRSSAFKEAALQLINYEALER